MAFSVSTDRSRSQESPTLWLSLLAGSLALHLVLLLLGRWYLSQTASAPAGNAQAPLDFVEIDPNAPALKRPIAPSNTPTQTVSKAVPPQTAPAEQPLSPSSIESLARQATPERTQPRISSPASPVPTTPVNQPNRSQVGQLPTESAKPDRTSTTPSRPVTPSRENNPAPTSPAGGSSSGATSPGGSPSSSPPNGGASGSSATNPSSNTKPDETSSGGSSTGGSTSGTTLSGNSTFQGKIAQALERDPNERQRDGAQSITLKNETIPPMGIAVLAKYSGQVLDLKVLVIMDREGRVFKTEVRDDSPAFQANPGLKEPKTREDLEGAVFQMLSNTDSLFEVKPEANTTPDQLFSRIAQIQVKIAQ